MVKDIIPAVDKEALEAELSPDRLVRRYKGLEVYIVTAHNAPHVMDEIGRIREIEFRKEGGGTAQEKDVDHYDTGDIPYKQIVAWDGQEREIVAMYRYILCRDAVITPDDIKLATYRLFHFSDRFKRQVLPQTIELGRSVVNRSAKRALYGLYVIWCGLAALVCEYPDIDYFFGKTTLYDTYNVEARDTLLYFMELYFSGGEEPENGPMVIPREELRYDLVTDRSQLEALFGGKNYKRDYAVLLSKLASLGESMPPIIKAINVRLTRSLRRNVFRMLNTSGLGSLRMLPTRRLNHDFPKSSPSP